MLTHYICLWCAIAPIGTIIAGIVHSVRSGYLFPNSYNASYRMCGSYGILWRLRLFDK